MSTAIRVWGDDDFDIAVVPDGVEFRWRACPERARLYGEFDPYVLIRPMSEWDRIVAAVAEARGASQEGGER